MRRLLVTCTAAWLLAAAGGCEPRDADEPQAYDPGIDACASSLMLAANSEIAADQRQISREAAAAAGPGEGAPAPAGPAPASAPAGAAATQPATMPSGGLLDIGGYLRRVRNSQQPE